MYDFILKQNIPFIVITNKADKIAITKVDGEVNRIKEILGISYSTILPFSAERKIYQDRVWEEIDSTLGTQVPFGGRSFYSFLKNTYIVCRS